MLFFRLLKMSSPTAAPVAASKFINSPHKPLAHIIIAAVSPREYLLDQKLQLKIIWQTNLRLVDVALIPSKA